MSHLLIEIDGFLDTTLIYDIAPYHYKEIVKHV